MNTNGLGRELDRADLILLLCLASVILAGALAYQGQRQACEARGGELIHAHGLFVCSELDLP